MNSIFKVAVITFAFVIAAFSSQAATLPYGKEIQKPSYNLDFTLVNQTGYTISHVYVAPSKQYEWGDDIMKQDMVLNGEQVDITFSTQETARLWDIYLKWDGYESDEDVFWLGFDLSKISIITLFYDAKTNKTWAEFE